MTLVPAIPCHFLCDFFIMYILDCAKEGNLWVPVSSTGKVSCRRARDLGSNPAYTKNQLVSWPDGKSNHHERTL